jgi:hypothetical protein
MIQEPDNVANTKRDFDLARARATASWAAFRNPLIWGAYLAQIAGFILIFFVLFPATQPRLVLVLAYALPTMFVVRRLHGRVSKKILDARPSNNEPA